LVGILHVFLILLLLQVLLEPGDQVPSGRELLIVEVEPGTADLDQFADGVSVLEHVDEEDELGVVLGNAKVVVDVAAILLGFTPGLVIDCIDGD
jgi:hypothetical protein